MKKRILALLICMVVIMQGLDVNVAYVKGDAENEDTSILNLVDKCVNAEKQFSNLSMKVNMLRDGNASIKYNMEMNSTYLNRYRNKIEDSVKEGKLKKENFPIRENYQSDDAFQNAVNTYNDEFYQKLSDSDLPEPKLVLVYDKSVYGVPDKDTHIALIDDASKEEIGNCDFTENEQKDIVLTCTFKKLVYNRSSVVVSFSLDYLIKLDLSVGESLAPVWLNDEAIISGQPEVKDNGYVAIDSKYSLKKTAPSSVITPYIDYTIRVKVDDGELNGKTIVDKIPEGLYVESVSNGKNQLARGEYSIVGNEFRYTFPKLEYDSGNLIKDTTLLVRMYILENNYKNLMKDNKFEHEFINEAFLKDLKKNEQLTPIETTKTKMSLVFLEKEGIQEDLFGQRFKWYVRVNSYFSQEVNTYIVDTINSSAHKYDFSSGIEVLKNGKPLEIIKPCEVDKEIAYDELTVKDLNEMTINPDNPDEKRAVYYTYKEESGIEKSVIIIPYNRFLNDRYNFNYYTNINIPEEGNAQFITKEKLKNKVKLMWDYIKIGDGKGINSDFNIELEKVLQAKADIVKKSYNKYNPVSNEISWIIDVNKFETTGGVFDKVEVKDTLDQAIQKFPDELIDGTGSIIATYKKGKEKKSILIPSEGNKVEDKPYYYMNSIAGTTKKTIIIKLGNMSSDEAYQIELKTIITKKEFFMNSNTITFSNLAEVIAENHGVVCGNESRGYAPLSNKLINKYAIKQKFKNTAGVEKEISYDNKRHTTKWRTVINEDAVSLKNAKIVEELPDGSSLDHFSLLTIYKPNGQILYNITSDDGMKFSVDGGNTFIESSKEANGMVLSLPNGGKIKWNEEQGKETPEGKNFRISKNKLNIDFGEELNYKVEYEFYTKYDETYRKEYLVNRTLSEETICTANLTAEFNKEIMGPVTRKATHIIHPVVLKKDGWYNRSEASITWTIHVNQDAVLLDHFIVLDTLKNAFELNKKSIQVFKYEVTPLGEEENLVNVTDDFLEAVRDSEEHKFKLNIPEQYKDVPIVIKFDTDLSDDISIEDATNRASLNREGNQYWRTDSIRPANMETFTMEQFIKLSPLAALFVQKVSNNNQALSGATFKLVAMKEEGSGWTEDEERYSKIRTSKEDGSTVFFNLERDRLYRLEELHAPKGYKRLETTKYLVFSESQKVMKAYPEGTQIIESTVKTCNIKYENESQGSIQFKKLGTDGNKVVGAKFHLVNVLNPDITYEKISDDNGNVEFSKIDAGKYLLKESVAPVGYFPIEDVMITVSVSDEEIWSFDMENKSFVNKDMYGAYVIKDEIDVLASPQPSLIVSEFPKETPSIAPKETPSIAPKETPSIEPKETPSIAPKETPSIAPKVTPSIAPKETPSIEPKETPSIEPKATPSMEPKVTPSVIPKITPGTAEYESEVIVTTIPDATPFVPVKPSEQVKPTKKPTPTKTVKPEPTIKPSNSSTEGYNASNSETSGEGKRRGSSSRDESGENSTCGSSHNNPGKNQSSYNEDGGKGHKDGSGSSLDEVCNTERKNSDNYTNDNTIPKTGDSENHFILYVLLGVLSLSGVIYFGKHALRRKL